MTSATTLDDAFRLAVAPGPERLMSGVALAASGLGRVGKDSSPEDYFAAYGTLSLDPASGPVTTKTVMWIVSCTKLVTTIAALQCVERGVFSLDNPADVDRLLPEWKDPEILTGWTDDEKPIMQPAKERITLRTLLTHTSGVSYDFMDPRLIKWRKSRGEGALTYVTPVTEGFKTPLVFEPGQGWVYGGGMDLVGLMVARANECTLEAYMRKNILDILGMPDTSMYVERNNLRERLMPMTSRATPEEPLMDGCPPDAPLKQLLEPTDEFGGGGLFSTAEDYLKLLKSILRNDGQLLKPSSIDLMFTPAMTPSAQESLNATLTVPAVARIMTPGKSVGVQIWSHGLGGLVAGEDSEEGLKAGWMRWGGAPNLKWWIDRKGGTCGFFATQLYPPGEPKHAFLNNMFQKEMVARFGKIGV